MNVSSVSDYALKLLGERAQGSVHSVFATSFNVELAGELIHIGSEDAPLSCLGATVAAGEASLAVRAIEAGDPAEWDGRSLVVHGRARTLAFNLAHAPRRGMRVPHALAAEGMGLDAELYRALDSLHLAERIGLPWEGEERSHTALMSLARFSSMCLAHALGYENPVRVEAASRAMSGAVGYLVGRGLGLTPSGDDVLCGFGCGLRFLYGVDPLAQRFFDDVAAAVLGRGKTTAVSEAYLAAICEGYANADYLELCETLRSHEVAMLPTRLSRVLEVGHTSGADGLFGFAAAFCCLM